MKRDDVTQIMGLIDMLIQNGNTAYAPRWGWHDDHRLHDGEKSARYLPALQQVRSEFHTLVEALAAAEGVIGGSALQLGLGQCRASHDVLASMFPAGVLTIDVKECVWTDTPGQYVTYPGADTHSARALHIAKSYMGAGHFDFLFIDAGHEYNDVRADYLDYGRLVRPGGIIAFHDALERDGYPELGVSKFLAAEIPHDQINIIGTEVGIAWLRKA